MLNTHLYTVVNEQMPEIDASPCLNSALTGRIRPEWKAMANDFRDVEINITLGKAVGSVFTPARSKSFSFLVG
jgi:hypothetical protein